jgi:hypothetical protein
VVAALLVEYRDGLRGACICLDRHVGDFTFATRRQDGVTLSSLFFLGGPPQSAYHGVQVQHMETLMATGRPDLPLERTVLTTGILAHLMDSRGEGHRRLETPELDIAYPAPPDDGHARGPMPVLCPWCPGGRYEPQAA